MPTPIWAERKCRQVASSAIRRQTNVNPLLACRSQTRSSGRDTTLTSPMGSSEVRRGWYGVPRKPSGPSVVNGHDVRAGHVKNRRAAELPESTAFAETYDCRIDHSLYKLSEGGTLRHSAGSIDSDIVTEHHPCDVC